MHQQARRARRSGPGDQGFMQLHEQPAMRSVYFPKNELDENSAAINQYT